MILAPIGVSTYSRINHLKQTVEALQKNTLAQESELYIFSDAPQKGDEEIVAKVREYIHTVDGFKKVHIVERETNGRVANNRGGMKQLLDEYGKIIWLEEDIVTASGFLQFMNDALEYYKDDEQILTVSGYTVPLKFLNNYNQDIYILQRFNAWGFATWRDKFDSFSFDIREHGAEDFFSNKIAMKEFQKNGTDMYGMLLKEYTRELDALDVKIMFYEFIYNKYTLYPRKSLVQNIGHDGSGIHCGVNDKFHHGELWDKTENFNFINNLKVDERIRQANYKFRSAGFKRKVKKFTKTIGIYPMLKKLRVKCSMKSPIFLFSLPRSGSTLLQRVLMSHKDIASVAEPWLMLPFSYAYKKEGALTEYAHNVSYAAFKDFIDNLPSKEDDYYEALGDFAHTLYEKQCVNNEKYFLDKTPRYYHIIPQIVKAFPDAKFIFLFRNPIHVMSSMMQTWSNGRFKKMYSYEMDLNYGPKALSEGYKLLKDKSYAVRYEQYVTNPEKYTKEICKYLGMDFDEAMLKSFASQDTKGRMGDSTGIKEYKSVDTKSLEKWKSTFNTDFRKNYIRNYIESIDGNIFSMQGYDKKVILEEIEKLNVDNRFYFKDNFDLIYSDLVRILKPNIWFGRTTKVWAKSSYLS